MKKEIETVAEHCKHKDCVYRSRISSSNQTTEECCDYILFAGESRKCKISECDKHRKGKRKRVFLTDGVIRYILEFDDEVNNI